MKRISISVVWSVYVDIFIYILKRIDFSIKELVKNWIEISIVDVCIIGSCYIWIVIEIDESLVEVVLLFVKISISDCSGICSIWIIWRVGWIPISITSLISPDWIRVICGVWWIPISETSFIFPCRVRGRVSIVPECIVVPSVVWGCIGGIAVISQKET
jgi:hypothetical protein